MADATDTAKSRAEELGVDIEAVEGTGQDGRVTAPDVEAFAKAQTESVEESQESSEPPKMVEAILNTQTGLGGYGFKDGFNALPRKRYSMTEAQYKERSKEKHRGTQVLVKP